MFIGKQISSSNKHKQTNEKTETRNYDAIITIGDVPRFTVLVRGRPMRIFQFQPLFSSVFFLSVQPKYADIKIVCLWRWITAYDSKQTKHSLNKKEFTSDSDRKKNVFNNILLTKRWTRCSANCNSRSKNGKKKKKKARRMKQQKPKQNCASKLKKKSHHRTRDLCCVG